MRSKIKFSVFIIFLFISVAGSSQKASSVSVDERLVRAAILDYVEGVYQTDTTRIYRSVHPTLVKRGTFLNPQTGEFSEFSEMSFPQLIKLTKSWNKDGNRANAKTLREISIYDVQDKTATAKVIAAWGIDYFHLAKIDGKWYIMNVLWQSLKSN